MTTLLGDELRKTGSYLEIEAKNRQSELKKEKDEEDRHAAMLIANQIIETIPELLHKAAREHQKVCRIIENTSSLPNYALLFVCQWLEDNKISWRDERYESEPGEGYSAVYERWEKDPEFSTALLATW